MSKKSEGFFRIAPKSGKKYIIRVKSVREGKKVNQKFLSYVGSLEEIKKVVCNECIHRTTK